MSTTAQPDLGTLAREIVSDGTRELALRTQEMSQAVRDAADDYADSIEQSVTASEQLRADLADLEKKKDLVPTHGFVRLREEAVAQAAERGGAADRRAELALGALREALTDAALPRLEPGREALARQELEIAFRGDKGGPPLSRAIQIAKHGSREAVAAMLSPFGQTLLVSAGLEGRSLNEALTTARTVAAHTAVERGETTRELAAGLALRHVGKLGAARTAAVNHLGHISGRLR